ncbi:TylF/MycF/NovP-related O-methyltransferase [Pseudomonas gingeri]|uniref:TylF/MycF/NovP-related O-methyltransferase n=1 Tax=Pseudomonas gingeri TaxID=117681 RepID=UPI001C4317DE|nr:TylF/MycF/NovP-related O-methyltransferase [Pseudomonas gingeri]
MTLPVDFSPEKYLELHDDVRVSGMDPVQHFLHYGKKEGRAYKGSRALYAKANGNYSYDGLLSIHNHDFMVDDRFMAAYGRGVAAAGTDYKWYWRVYMGLWAARSAAKYVGDFVECGVNYGFLSSAIMYDLDWNNTDRMFYLLDTFSGIDERFLSEEERTGGVAKKSSELVESGVYTSNLDAVKKNFSDWHNTKIIPGSIPETLSAIDSTKIAFLHIDLNSTIPEVAAIEFLWDRLVSGAFILLDDYAYYGYQPQKEGMDKWAAKMDLSIASLPTGQGLLIKP